MRTPGLPLTLLTLVLLGCSDPLPTGPATGGAAVARAASHRVALPFHGTLDEASHTSHYDPVTNTGFVHLVGTGTATHLGRYTVVSELALSPVTIAGPERMTLTAANGDVLTAEGWAQGTPAEDGLTLSSVESMTITGGTGRFAGATGHFVLRQVNLAPDRLSSGSFDGTISFDR